VYKDRSKFEFNKTWNELLTKYYLRNNKWMVNLCSLREKMASMYHDSFTTYMTMTQRSKDMNNVLKKFHKKHNYTVFQNSLSNVIRF
jgi:ppGpp synthetase/RelA/SpoT-type nucleotidyltranferase